MLGSGGKQPHRHKRALLFVDNSGADVILGMLPLAREFLRRGTEVCIFSLALPIVTYSSQNRMYRPNGFIVKLVEETLNRILL